MRKDYKVQVIQSSAEKGIFSKQEWLKEAKKHMYSSRVLNDHSQKTRQELNRLTEAANTGRVRGNSSEIVELISEFDASSKSSLLLLSYSMELLIKAALVCLHKSTTRQDFNRLLKSKYSHNLSESAKLLAIPLTQDESKVLDRMKVLMLDEARYPVTPTDQKSYFKQVNKINQEVWSTDLYEKWLGITITIQDFVMKIDSDKANPSMITHYTFGDDGYCVFRFGGNLPPYLIVHFSCEQVRNKENNVNDLLELLRSCAPDSLAKRHLLKIESALVYIDVMATKP